ncbi:gamma-glutamyltransferase family protein [Treponema sp. OttesenSCG-928-L16]|nr:gamma-glutamyltransferase family protein [Treponema sp. OttesenSCG-928-L16]
MNFDPYHFPYPSRRHLVYGERGMVCSSQPLASQLGLDVMKRGGNAVDAVICAAAALTVLEPASNGLGSDAFAIVWPAGAEKPQGLNASGPAPLLMTEDRIREKGFDAIPMYGIVPVTVPGAISAWAALSQRYGKFPLDNTLEGAAALAEQGFPLSPVSAASWKAGQDIYLREFSRAPELYRGWSSVFAPGGKAPGPGETVVLEAHAATIREIGKTGGESFYRGAIAADIDRYMREHNGFLRSEDLAAFSPEWVDPVSVNYRGYDIWEIPPNGQGLVALMALNIFKNFESPGIFEDAEVFHKKIEALKLAFADGHHYIGDPRFVSWDYKKLISEDYGRLRSRLIGDTALEPAPGKLPSGGTVYLCAADRDGNMVSYIQSNFCGFGSGAVLPERGISFQNRGYGFNLDRNSVKYVEGGKRPFHTIIPGFISRGTVPLGPFGIMGGAMQPQAHFQVISNLVDHQFNPQAALDAPRWMWDEGKRILAEPAVPKEIIAALQQRGHDIGYEQKISHFGRGQIILRQGSGVYAGATEPRCDGYTAVW